MFELTDSMIIKALKNTVWYNDNDMALVLILIGAVCVFTGLIFFFTRNGRQKFGAGMTFLIFLIMGIMYVNNESFMKNSIDNGEWEVRTDIVDRVMQETDSDGDVSYFMVLDEYGRVSLDSYSEACQYYSGAEVYVVIIPKGNSFERTGVAYPADTYIYVGNH